MRRSIALGITGFLFAFTMFLAFGASLVLRASERNLTAEEMLSSFGGQEPIMCCRFNSQCFFSGTSPWPCENLPVDPFADPNPCFQVSRPTDGNPLMCQQPPDGLYTSGTCSQSHTQGLCANCYRCTLLLIPEVDQYICVTTGDSCGTTMNTISCADSCDM